MDAQSHSSISAGLVIFAILSENEEIGQRVTRIFPVAITAENAKLPFIVYRTVKQEPMPVKPQRGLDSCQVAVDCAAAGYKEAVELAEMVRRALEESDREESGIQIASCEMSDREEFYEDDAFVERLIFTITV